MHYFELLPSSGTSTVIKEGMRTKLMVKKVMLKQKRMDERKKIKRIERRRRGWREEEEDGERIRMEEGWGWRGRTKKSSCTFDDSFFSPLTLFLLLSLSSLSGSELDKNKTNRKEDSRKGWTNFVLSLSLFLFMHSLLFSPFLRLLFFR